MRRDRHPGFSFKAILIKLAILVGAIDPITLLTLRMIYSLPFFALMEWWATRSPDARRCGAPLAGHSLAGVHRYYLASLLDFIGLQYSPASLERLVLVPHRRWCAAFDGAVQAAHKR